MIGRTIWSLMERYGQEVEVVRGEEYVSTRAFLQPILSKREDAHQYLPTPLGLRREDSFLYLGMEELTAGQDRVGWNGQKFCVQTAQPIYVGSELSHWWAVLVPADKERT